MHLIEIFHFWITDKNKKKNIREKKLKSKSNDDHQKQFLVECHYFFIIPFMQNEIQQDRKCYHE